MILKSVGTFSLSGIKSKDNNKSKYENEYMEKYYFNIYIYIYICKINKMLLVCPIHLLSLYTKPISIYIIIVSNIRIINIPAFH